MSLRRCSLILPGYHLEDFPTHLVGDRAAEFLAAWTALWHPSLLAETGQLPAWHPAGSPPEPETLEGELVVAPHLSRERLPSDWIECFAATQPRNSPLLEPFANRVQTIAAVLEAASIVSQGVDRELVGDFFALGYAYLQVELLTRVMRHTTLLSLEQFSEAAIEAARAATAGNRDGAGEGLSRALDLLGDARNHYYPVDYYLLDITLLAPTTLGEPLRAKLASGSPTSLLASGELVAQMAAEHPATLAELRRAIEAGTACVIGGPMQATTPDYQSPEGMLREFELGRRVYERHLGRGVGIFAQHDASFSTLLPALLNGLGFRGALHTSFDGGSLAQADQPKTWWCGPDGQRIEAISTTPLDAGLAETWLALADRVGDSLSHDHISTLLFAGWPGHGSEFADDLRRVAKYSTVLGKLVTLDEYFTVSREVDDWITFQPREYGRRLLLESPSNPLSSAAIAYHRDVANVHEKLGAGLTAVVPLENASAETSADAKVVLNPWSFARPQYSDAKLRTGATGSAHASSCATGFASARGDDRHEVTNRVTPEDQALAEPAAHFFWSEVPACGFARLDTAAAAPAAPLVAGNSLRNERLEIVISETTGGIQSVRVHSNRSTRASQRIVFCDRRASGRAYRASADDETPEANVRMVAERVEITRNDALAGEITSHGQLLNGSDAVLARFQQTTSLPRGAPAVFVEITLAPQRAPEGSFRNSYFASRLVWRGDALGVRRGTEWTGRETRREWIESAEWVEIVDGAGTITCFGMGLPLHRLVSPSRLDTLLSVAGEEVQRFRYAIGLDCPYPTLTALAIESANEPAIVKSVGPAVPRQGWFLHVSAKNVIVTHIAPLAASRSGVRLRLLETEGRDAEVALKAFREIKATKFTDFRGAASEVISVGTISVADGQARFAMGAYGWVQVELEW